MSRYLLVPVDGLEKESKVVTIPNGLVVDPFEELYQHVRDKELLKNLLIKLYEFGISEDHTSGYVKHKDKVLEGVKFRDALLDSCNGKYLECYESFYELLRKFDIVF